MKTKTNGLKEKQLRSRLEGVKGTKQLRDILRNVERQNASLRDDTLALKYKVDLLQQKQKAKESYVSPEVLGKEREVHMLQIELKEQYKIMQELKKRREHAPNAKATEELASQVSIVTNQLKSTEVALTREKTALDDLRREAARLDRTLALLEEEDKRNKPKLDEYSSENSELRKRIQSLRKLEHVKESQSSKIMNSMYSIKTKIHKNQQIEKEFETRRHFKSTNNLHEQYDLPTLSKEVASLRQEYEKRIDESRRQQVQWQRRRDEALSDNKEAMSIQKQLQERRNRLTGELNKFRRIWEKYLEYKQNSKFLKEYVESPTQAEEPAQPEEPLRRDFAGVLGGRISFDDRFALGGNRRSFITGFIAYQLENNASNRNNLVGLRAIYDDPEANTLNHPPIPGAYLAKCKINKYLLMEGDFIKLLKVKYIAADSRILKVELRTNRNQRFQFGDRRPFNELVAGQNVYGFDISVGQYPVSLFGSYNSLRTNWYLQSLGVEINDLEQ